MSFLTVTYHPRASEFVEPNLSAFGRQFPSIPTRKCLTPIPGLLSESFEVPSSPPFRVEQSPLAGELSGRSIGEGKLTECDRRVTCVDQTRPEIVK